MLQDKSLVLNVESIRSHSVPFDVWFVPSGHFSSKKAIEVNSLTEKRWGVGVALNCIDFQKVVLLMYHKSKCFLSSIPCCALSLYLSKLIGEQGLRKLLS